METIDGEIMAIVMIYFDEGKKIEFRRMNNNYSTSLFTHDNHFKWHVITISTIFSYIIFYPGACKKLGYDPCTKYQYN